VCSSLYYKVINRVWPDVARQIRRDNDDFNYQKLISLCKYRAAATTGGLHKASTISVPFKDLAYYYKEGFIVAWNKEGDDRNILLLYNLSYAGHLGKIECQTVQIEGSIIQACVAKGKVVYCYRISNDEYDIDSF